MIPEKRFLLYNAAIATGEGVRNGSVAVCGERISDVWYPDGDGLLGFRLTQAVADEPPVLEAKISVRLNPETFLDDTGDNR